MTYELAKKLKDAGFPQGFQKNPDLVISDEGELEDPKKLTLLPTLSELIEACGDKFDALSRLPAWAEGKWEAYYDTGSGIGYTPEEAVANLWLELHKNV